MTDEETAHWPEDVQQAIATLKTMLGMKDSGKLIGNMFVTKTVIYETIIPDVFIFYGSFDPDPELAGSIIHSKNLFTIFAADKGHMYFTPDMINKCDEDAVKGFFEEVLSEWGIEYKLP